jgi:hypothetical protein
MFCGGLSLGVDRPGQPMAVIRILGLGSTVGHCRAGPCACPNGGGNHRGIAPTEDGRSYDQARILI